MTIASARKMGLLGVELACQSCRRSGFKSFDQLALPEETAIPAVARARNFACSECGGRTIISLPDWSAYQAPGIGGMGI
jgi:hypothetical protein